ADRGPVAGDAVPSGRSRQAAEKAGRARRTAAEIQRVDAGEDRAGRADELGETAGQGPRQGAVAGGSVVVRIGGGGVGGAATVVPPRARSDDVACDRAPVTVDFAGNRAISAAIRDRTVVQPASGATRAGFRRDDRELTSAAGCSEGTVRATEPVGPRRN